LTEADIANERYAGLSPLTDAHLIRYPALLGLEPASTIKPREFIAGLGRGNS